VRGVGLLRRLVAAIRISPEERHAECAERCLELLCDPERAPAVRLGEHEEAAIEATRRRWDTLHPPPSTP
jgi:hypothetical protein